MTISTLHKAMVILHLKYGNARWGPFSQGDKKSVESVQRRATKLIHGFNVKSYEDRIKQLKLPSLGYRRKRGDMIWMFKIMNGLVRVDASKLFVQASLSQTRGHPQKVSHKREVTSRKSLTNERSPAESLSQTRGQQQKVSHKREVTSRKSLTNERSTAEGLSQTRGHPQKVFKKHAVKLARINSFSQRCVNDWNSLQNFVVEAPSHYVKSKKN